jgi:4-carboxymuconolactone decarboxylase
MTFFAPLCVLLALSTGAAMAQTGLFDTASPALSHYDATVVEGDLWQRPDLSPRDRSVVTVAALIARQQTALMPQEISRALENGVTPDEMSEMVTHLAFYAGWGNAAAAAKALAPIFEAQGVAAPERSRMAMAGFSIMFQATTASTPASPASGM